MARLEVLCVIVDSSPEGDTRAHPILLYDGVCGLCNWTVQFILRRDGAGVFRFAALQGELAKRVLARHGADAGALTAAVVVVDFDEAEERLLSGPDAAVFILRHLGGGERGSAHPQGNSGATAVRGAWFWRVAGRLLNIVPRGLREWGDRMVARHRYRIFGKYDSCPVPSVETRARFLDGG